MMGTNRFSFDLADVSWVLDDADLGHLLALLREVREVVLDLETTGLDEYAEGARIVLASFTAAAPGSDRPSTLLLPLSHPDSPFSGRWRRVMASVADILVEHGTPVVGQNIKFDARWVHAGTGTDISGLIAWDTRVSSHLLDETASTSLKERAPRTFGIRRWDDFSLKEPGAAERVPLIQLGEYAARDTYWTWALSVLHREQMLLTGDLAIPETPEEIEAARLGKLAVRCAMPTVSTLAAVEQRGILLDLEWAGRGLVDHSAEADRLSEALADRVDWEDRDPDDEPSFAPTSTWFQAWARAAVADGLLRVAALTPTGKPQWNKSVLVRQARSGSDTAIDLLAMRSHAKKAEFLSSWIAKAHGGVIRTTYNAGVVSTGRLSSSDPNMQQVTESLKPAFVPRAGNVFIDLDYCLEGSMRILTSDLRWVPADQIQVGEKIIGFPEQFGRGAGRSHQYEEAEITSVKQITRPSVILVMSDGQHIKCSREHRWMRGGKQAVREWVQAGDLQPGDVIPTLTDPWDEPRTVQEVEDRAYLRGILDGEGWVNETTVGWGQLPGEVYDEVQAVSERLGLDWRVNSFMNNGVIQQRVSNVRDSLRILGMVRPVRLLPKARQMWEGRNTWGKSKTGAMVMEVIDAGEQPVWAIGTSTKTMVVEGLLSHNSQIELRAAAFIARCAPMIEAFRRGDDLHRLLASAITGKPEHEVLPAERQAGKSANFGLLYGMGAVGFQKYAEDVYDVSFTLAEAQAIRSTFFSTWEGMAEWHARTGEKLYRTGRAVSPIGRVRRLPMIDDGMPDMESYAARAAINAPVQGFASDIMQIAAASIEGRLPGSVAVHGASIVATVHDSILVEAPEDRWEQVLDACAHRMKDAVPEALLGMGCALDVPLDVSAKVGTRWGLSDVASR